MAGPLTALERGLEGNVPEREALILEPALENKLCSALHPTASTPRQTWSIHRNVFYSIWGEDRAISLQGRSKVNLHLHKS